MSNTVNIRNYATFANLYNQGYAASAKIEARRIEAANGGNTVLAAKLLDEWAALSTRLNQLRASEIAYLTSHAPNGHSSAVSRLRGVVKQGDKALNELESLAKALTGAAKIISILTRMIALPL